MNRLIFYVLLCLVHRIKASSNAIFYEMNAIQYYGKFINNLDKDSFDSTTFNLNIYEDEEIKKIKIENLGNSLIMYNSKFDALTYAEKNILVSNHELTYKCTIQLLVTAFLNKWSLTEIEQFDTDNIYLRNLLIITLESLLDITTNISIGNIDTDNLRDLINTLSSSLYYDDYFISRSAYSQNEEILNYPAYSAIGRGYEIPDDKEKYIKILKDFSEGNKITSPCPYGFDHKLSLIMLGLCDYNESMLENTNKYNLIHLYQDGTSSFITSNRFIYSAKNAFQYFSTASNIILNRNVFNSNYLNPKNNNIESIVKELFTLYDIENFLYSIHIYNLDILPYEIYYKNEYDSMSKNAISLFNVYSDIVDTINDIIVNEIEDKFIISSLLTILHDNIKIIYNDSNNANKVDEYNSIVRMFNNFFINSYYNYNLKYYINILYLDYYPSYYPDNQLSNELLILSKYYNEVIKIDNMGKLTIPTNAILSNIINNYNYKNVGLDDSLNEYNNISPSEYFSDLLEIINNKIITNYYGDYYSDDLNKYIAIFNKYMKTFNLNDYIIDEAESSGNIKYKETNYSFNNIDEIIDNRFMVYYINNIVDQIKNNSIKTAVTHMKYLNNIFNLYLDDEYYLNKLYFLYNIIASNYNELFNKNIVLKSIKIEELELFIKNLELNEYNTYFNYYDIKMLDNLKYYLYNQPQYKANKNIINVIEKIDELFIKSFIL